MSATATTSSRCSCGCSRRSPSLLAQMEARHTWWSEVPSDVAMSVEALSDMLSNDEDAVSMGTAQPLFSLLGPMLSSAERNAAPARSTDAKCESGLYLRHTGGLGSAGKGLLPYAGATLPSLFHSYSSHSCSQRGDDGDAGPSLLFMLDEPRLARFQQPSAESSGVPLELAVETLARDDCLLFAIASTATSTWSMLYRVALTSVSSVQLAAYVCPLKRTKSTVSLLGASHS